MNRIVLFILPCILMLNFPLAAQNTASPPNKILRGIVKLQSSGSKVLPDVKISAFGSTPVHSDDAGMFEMTFPNKTPGEHIKLFVEKQGYEVINEKDLENCILSKDHNYVFYVIMAKEGQRDKQALRYYNIIIENVNSNYTKELKVINNRLNELDEDDAKRQVLRQQIATLQKEKEAAIKRAEELAKQLAIVDLDRASELARQAFKKFNTGDVKAALAILTDEALAKSLQEAQTEVDKQQKKLQKAKEAVQQSIENYMIKARFYITDGNYKAANINYVKAVAADTTNINNTWELADLYDELNQQKRAIRYYRQALGNNPSDAVKAALLNNLGKQYYNINSYKKADSTYNASLKIYKRLVKTNPARYESELARTILNLGVLYSGLHDYSKAGEAYKASLEIYKRLAKENHDRYVPELARTLLNLGILYQNINDYNKAVEAYKASLKIYKRLAKENPARYETDLALTLMNLGKLYSDLNDYKKASDASKASLEIRKRLAKENPERYEPELGRTILNLGNLYQNLNDYNKVAEAYKASLEIYKRLTQKNPERYEPKLALTFMNLGNLYKDLGDYPGATEAYKASLEIYKRLAKKSLERYEPELANTLMNLGNLYKDLGDYHGATETYKASLEIYKRLAKGNPARYEPDLARTLMNLGILYRDLNDFNKATETYQASLEIYKRLAYLNPTKYESGLAPILLNLGNLYSALNDYNKATETYQASLEIYKRLAKDNPKGYNLALIRILINMAYLKKQLMEEKRDLTFKKEGLEVIKEVNILLEGYENSEIPLVATLKKHTAYLQKYFTGITKEALEVQATIRPVLPLEEKIETVKNPAAKVHYKEEVTSVLETALKRYPQNIKLLTRTANAYSNLAWYYLFTRQFNNAEQAAKKGLQMDKTQQWINTILAISFLFQGKLEPATEIYKRLKDLPYGEGTYRKVFLEDLQALEDAGITHKDVAKIRELLGK